MRGLSLVGEHYLTRSVPFSSLLCLRCRETLGVTMSVTHTDKPSPLLWTGLARRYVEQVMRVVRRSVQGDHPTPGRGQAIAPPMDGPGKPLRGHTCRCADSSLLA